MRNLPKAHFMSKHFMMTSNELGSLKTLRQIIYWQSPLRQKGLNLRFKTHLNCSAGLGSGRSSVGRAPASQAGCRGFESLRPLHSQMIAAPLASPHSFTPRPGTLWKRVGFATPPLCVRVPAVVPVCHSLMARETWFFSFEVHWIHVDIHSHSDCHKRGGS